MKLVATNMGRYLMTDYAAEVQDRSRAQHWAVLGRLLVAAPDRAVLEALAGLVGDATTPFGRAYAGLAEAAATADPGSVASEYFELFVGIGRGELLPYASFYLTGFLNERPLADLRRDLAVMGIERAAGRHDPEDHIATLCEVMSGLAAGDYDAAALGCGAAGEAGFFARHLEPWADSFFADLARAPSARFYRHVAEIGRLLIEIEGRGFELARGTHHRTAAGLAS